MAGENTEWDKGNIELPGFVEIFRELKEALLLRIEELKIEQEILRNAARMEDRKGQ